MNPRKLSDFRPRTFFAALIRVWPVVSEDLFPVHQRRVGGLSHSNPLPEHSPVPASSSTHEQSATFCPAEYFWRQSWKLNQAYEFTANEILLICLKSESVNSAFFYYFKLEYLGRFRHSKNNNAGLFLRVKFCCKVRRMNNETDHPQCWLLLFLLTLMVFPFVLLGMGCNSERKIWQSVHLQFILPSQPRKPQGPSKTTCRMPPGNSLDWLGRGQGPHFAITILPSLHLEVRLLG